MPRPDADQSDSLIPPIVWRAARWTVLGIFGLICLVILPRACTRVETGEVGLRKTFTGTVEMEPLGPGFHQSLVGNVIIFSAREVLVPVKELHPVTADKLPMEDVDIQL